jgi:putative DNA methylase
LRPTFPNLFSTVSVPKLEELVAFAYRHKNGKAGAEEHFLNGMKMAMERLSEQAHPHFPLTIFYAFKQIENDDTEGISSTGWETFLNAVIHAGFSITGTWPVRTEKPGRMRAQGSNALATSIVLVCRKKSLNSIAVSRRDFIVKLQNELPIALKHLQDENIAPVDLAQAAIGPGMAIFTSFSNVLDANGQPISVKAALMLINQILDESLADQDGDFDADSRWALTWFDQNGFSDGNYGVAEQLSKSKNISVSGLVESGILVSKFGNVRLLKPAELNKNWDPVNDKRISVWEIVHQLIRVLEAEGESAASHLLSKLDREADTAREFCYRLYTLCERKKRTSDAMSYNGLVQSWPEIVRLSSEQPLSKKIGTTDMFDKE